MKYMSSAGDYRVDRPGRLVARASRLAPELKWPFIGAIAVAAIATLVRLLGPLIIKGGIDNGIAEGDKGAILTAAAIYQIPYLTQ